MATQSSDTSPDAERVQIRILRAMPPWKRLTQVDGLQATATAMALADLRRRHPGASESELRTRLLDRLRAAWDRTDREAGATRWPATSGS